MGTSADLNRILNVRVGRYFVCAKPPLRRAESRFAEPRFSLWEGFNFVSAKPRLRRAELRFGKPRNSLWEGFNFASAKPPLRRAEARFGKPRKVPKGFDFVSGKVLLGWADSRFAKPRISLQGNVFWYFLRRAKSTAKTRRGLRPSGLPGTIQSSAEEDFSKVFRRHVSNPAFRTRRRRKGFESVRGSGATA